jgi:hypothetical protein
VVGVGSGTAAGTVVVVVVMVVVVVGGGGLFFGPAHGGFPFSTRRACFAARPLQTLVRTDFHRPWFEGVTAGGGLIVGGLTGGVVTGVVTGCGAGVGTVTTGGGDGGGCGVGADGCGAGGVALCRGATSAIADGVGLGTSIRVVTWRGETCGAGRTSDLMGPRFAGAVPGKSPSGGACRTSKERATDPATAAPAGANDPIAAIFSFIPSPALCRQPSLDAYVPIGGERPTLERARGLTIRPPIRRGARAFYEAPDFRFGRDMDIVRDGQVPPPVSEGRS